MQGKKYNWVAFTSAKLRSLLAISQIAHPESGRKTSKYFEGKLTIKKKKKKAFVKGNAAAWNGYSANNYIENVYNVK